MITDSYGHYDSPLDEGNASKEDVTVACCFPCVLIGTMTSMTSREKMLANKKKDEEGYTWGYHGCCSCLYTSCLCMTCWPCSPLLSYYIQDKRKRLNIMIPEDPRLKKRPYEDNYSFLKSAAYWSWNLLDLRGIYGRLQEEDTLPFTWDINSYKDHIMPEPAIKTITIMLFGAASVMKDEFFKKMLICSPSTESEIARVKENISGIRVGIKSFAKVDGDLIFVEVWDVPNSHIGQLQVQGCLMEKDTIAYLVFDATSEESDPDEDLLAAAALARRNMSNTKSAGDDPEAQQPLIDMENPSFGGLQQMLGQLSKLHGEEWLNKLLARCLCVAVWGGTVADEIEKMKLEEDMEGHGHVLSDTARKGNEVHEYMEKRRQNLVMDGARRWASERGCEGFYKVSLCHNDGFAQLNHRVLRLVQDPNALTPMPERTNLTLNDGSGDDDGDNDDGGYVEGGDNEGGDDEGGEGDDDSGSDGGNGGDGDGGDNGNGNGGSGGEGGKGVGMVTFTGVTDTNPMHNFYEDNDNGNVDDNYQKHIQ